MTEEEEIYASEVDLMQCETWRLMNGIEEDGKEKRRGRGAIIIIAKFSIKITI